MSAIEEAMLEQYKMLRLEVIELVNETRNLEILTLGAVAALFAWLVAQRKIEPRLWLLAPVLVLFGGLRAFGLFIRTGDIAEYMRKIEHEWQKKGAPLPGWETYFLDHNTFPLSWVTFVFWGALLVATGVAWKWIKPTK